MDLNQLPNPSELAAYWMLDPSVVFLNHGSFGACPREILDRQTALRAQMETDPVRFLTRELEALLDHSRATLAALLNTSPDNLAFIPNATTGVNAVVRSLAFLPDDEILTTDHDYNACRNALQEAARRTGARLVVARVPFPVQSEDEIFAAIMEAVTDRTRLVLLDHVTSPTSLVFPVERIVRALESFGVDVLVDGAHAPGMVPLDLDALRPAYYTGNCQKWLCAPKGSAFLYVRPDRQALVQPTTISHGYNTPRPGRNYLHTMFDWTGTQDPTPWLCVGDAIEWCDSLLPGGIGELMERNHSLAVVARRVLCAALGCEPPCPETMLGSMATIPLPAPVTLEGTDPLQVRLLRDYSIEAPVIRWGDPPARGLRISAQAYNSPDQYGYLAQALTTP